VYRQPIMSLYVYSKGGRRFSEGTSADREIQRTLMEVSDNKPNCM